MSKVDVYMYGMVLKTTSFLLKNDYPGPDSYGEFTKRFEACGGETGTAAVVLSSLGAKVMIDGNHLGKNTYPFLSAYYKSIGVDISPMTYDKNYDGLEDYVMTAKENRTCFGTFEAFFSNSNKGGRWNEPTKSDIKAAKIVGGLDPFFFDASKKVAMLCHELGKPYVTIDCQYDTLLNQYAAVNVVSNEYIRQHYEGHSLRSLFESYTEHTNGLVVFTFGGANEVMYGRKGGEDVKFFKPYELEVVSTLGAGDSFKAGAIYGLLKGLNDKDLVAFASATAGCALTHYPLVENPPTLKRVEGIMVNS